MSIATEKQMVLDDFNWSLIFMCIVLTVLGVLSALCPPNAELCSKSFLNKSEKRKSKEEGKAEYFDGEI